LQGTIFDIQTFSIYDGPGIRTTVFFKGCPLRCAWCQNPESQLLSPEISFFRERCKGCLRCVDACPTQALRIFRDGVRKDHRLCTCCGRCAAACPEGAREVIGRTVTPEEVVAAVEKDRPFFERSAGGVTLTGGEPTLQAHFLLNLLERFREQGIHTAMETCGFFSKTLMEKLIPRLDLFLFDLKHPDPTEHLALTGVSNERILGNCSFLIRRIGSQRVLLRIPLIPGVNTRPGTLQKILDFARTAGYDGPVHLMPYNPLIRTKYEKLGRQGEFITRDPLTDEDLDRIQRQLEKCGFSAVLNR
jgi:pyruvate formate lyase activating enzyme